MLRITADAIATPAALGLGLGWGAQAGLPIQILREKWIDWENSVWADHYKATLIGRLRQKSTINKFELPASAVTAKLLLALESKKPAPSYYITKPTYFMALMRRVLPTSWLERLLATI